MFRKVWLELRWRERTRMSPSSFTTYEKPSSSKKLIVNSFATVEVGTPS